MTITYEFESKESLLLVKAQGFDDDLEDVLAYGQAIITASIQQRCTRVLCDERELEYRINTIDTYTLAETLAEIIPRVVRLAIVCRPEDYGDGSFFETVAVNRGLTVRVFTDIDTATKWVTDEM